MTKTIVLASRNAGKIKELSSLLLPFGLHVKGMNDFPQIGIIEETGKTFTENALLKANTVSKLTNLVAIADDSGLEVDALNGEPGVYSARYSDEPGKPATDARNTEKVLTKMKGISQGRRGIRFVCAMAAAAPNGQHIIAEGAWSGILMEAPQGHEGFGYDPVFFDPQIGLTAAEMTPKQKNARSHRAKACEQLLAMWPDFWRSAAQ